jgi:transcription initiation factor IIE alpha subunit
MSNSKNQSLNQFETLPYDGQCPECGEDLGEGYDPDRGMICDTCAQHQIDMQIEYDIDKRQEGDLND